MSDVVLTGVNHRALRMPPALVASITLLILSAATFSGVEACSSRATPKPRTTTPTPRPNVTFHTYACPPAYATYYCLNGATCFTVKIAESLMYSCECSDGYMGNRCEFKDLDGSYLPTSLRQRVVLERASFASETSLVVILVVIFIMAAYMHCHRRQRGPNLAVRPPSPPAPISEPDSKLDSSVYLVPWTTMADTRWLPLRPAPPPPPLAPPPMTARPPLARLAPGLALGLGLGQDLDPKSTPSAQSLTQAQSQVHKQSRSASAQAALPAPVLVPVNRVFSYPGRGHFVLRQC